MDGIIYRYTPGTDEETYTKVKQVSSDKIAAYIEGNWMKQIRYKRKGEKVSISFALYLPLRNRYLELMLKYQEWKVLLDLDQLALIPKSVRPLQEQETSESRKLWDPVTQQLLSKNWGEATKQKQMIEQKQRDIARKLKEEEKE